MRLLADRGFVTFRELERAVMASPATLRRDLERLAGEGRLTRLHGGAKHMETRAQGPTPGLQGVPFHENRALNPVEKRAIGKAAAALCVAGEAVMIDGGSTTLQMCPHLKGMNLQVLTNSLHIVSALLHYPDVRVLVPGGAVFREQNIILAATDDDLMPRFHAPKLFMGAASIRAQGIMQADVMLVSAERRLIEKAEELIVLVDSSKFSGSAGNVVCGLEEVDIVVTDAGITDAQRRLLNSAGVRLIVV